MCSLEPPKGICHFLLDPMYVQKDFDVLQKDSGGLMWDPLRSLHAVVKMKGYNKTKQNTALFYPQDMDVINIANCGRALTVHRVTSIVLVGCLVVFWGPFVIDKNCV